MDTTSLHYFSEAAKDLNFTKTARRLFISQQNLSNHIARLEKHYGVQLFERRPHLSLTYSGEILLTYANNFKLEEDNLKSILSNIKETERGVLRIGCSPIRTNIAMPKLTELFSQKYPNVELHFYQEHSSELLKMLLTGELDFSISVATLSHPSLVATHLFKDSLYLMVSKILLEKHFGDEAEGLIQRSREGIHLKEFECLPFVNVRSSQIFRDVLNYSNCKPNFLITTTYPLFSQINLYENIAASIVTTTIYNHTRNNMADDIFFFPIILPPDMPLHDIVFIRHFRKYLSKYGRCFLDISIKYFDEMEKRQHMLSEYETD